MFSWSALPDLNQHHQGKTAPCRLLLWSPAAPPLCYGGTGTNSAVAWTGAKKGFILHSCTKANATTRERERHWATWLGILEGKEWSCPFWYKLLFHGIRLSVKPHPHDREPSLSLWWDRSCTMQCLLTWITIIYTVKSYEFDQLKGGGLGLPEGNDEVREW